MEEAPPSAQVADADNLEETGANQEEEAEPQRVKLVSCTIHDTGPACLCPQLPGSTPTAASFEFLDEGHTLGNALRFIIMKK